MDFPKPFAMLQLLSRHSQQVFKEINEFPRRCMAAPCYRTTILAIPVLRYNGELGIFDFKLAHKSKDPSLGHLVKCPPKAKNF